MEEKQFAYRMVEFPSEGTTLRGRLYLPFDASRPTPVIIMAHGFTATITGMVADKYAEVFQESGFAVLLYDHRSFGISGGEPRQQINRWIQARGYRDAMNFIATLPEVDPSRIALWGDSMSGAEVIVIGALDERVKAIVAQVPACGDTSPPDGTEESIFKSIQEIILHENVMDDTSAQTIGPLPVVSFDQVSAPSLLTPLTAFRWFIEYGGRYGTHWENRATVILPATPVPFHPALCAHYLKSPLLMMIAEQDEMPGSNSDVARDVFRRAPEPKEKVEIGGGHFGLLYYPSKLFEQVSRTQCNFLIRYLK